MSLIRVCAYAKYLNRRNLFEKYTVCMSFAECVQQCMLRRTGEVRRISETSWQLQRRNVSCINPKAEDGKNRVRVQSQLLNVLEARISQLQSDSVLNVQHAKVQLIRPNTSSRWVLSRKSLKNAPQDKTEIVKGPSKSKPSRWLEKLSKERMTKLTEKQHLQQKLQKNVEKKPPPNSKRSINRLMSPNTTIKTIVRAKKTVLLKEVKRQFALSEEISSALSPPVTSTTVSTATAISCGVSKWEQKSLKNQAVCETGGNVEKQAQGEELERRLIYQGSQGMSSSDQHEKSEGFFSRNMCLRIRCFLEACVFVGDIERAHRFLLNQHRLSGRRKHLSTDEYNIIIRMWAKHGMLEKIGRVLILLEEAGLKPNLGSYCASLECIGRTPNCSPKTVTRCLSQMKKDGFSMDDMFSQSIFQQDERDMVLKAIHTVQPDYQPRPNVTTHHNSSPLVQDFYMQRAGHRYPKLDITWKELQERFKRQLNMEESGTVTIDSVEAAKPVTEHMTKMRQLLAEHHEKWQKVLLQALRDSKRSLSKTSAYSCSNLYPYLCLLKDDEYVDIMLKSVSNMPSSGESLKVLAEDLGNKVFIRYSVRQKYKNQIVKKLETIYNAYTELLAKDTKEYVVLPRERWCKLEMEHSLGFTLQGDETRWPHMLILELGTYMIELMVNNLKIHSDPLDSSYNKKLIPVFYHMYTFRNTFQIGIIKPHPILTKMQLEAVETKLTFASSVMPMLCPPIPWSSVKSGAYLLIPTKLMRVVSGATQHDVLLEECKNLHPVMDSLNQLGNCAWKINKPLLDVIISIFNHRGNEKLDIPPPLSEAPKIPYFNPHDPSYTSSEKAQMKRNVITAKKTYGEMHSLRMDALYKLSIANHLRDEIFWFPHNMDFRGRTYPCPPHLNHLGNDVTRSILVFAEGKPLGSKGLDWLKIHLINLTGLKKRSSLQERLQFANTIMEDILDSADNPLNGKKWWMNADEPWQALGCCMEIAKATRSADPTQFISHFPVHQDGSCNGLQHYAALGRDVIGATSVNLVPSEVPQDVYSGVAQQVEEFRAQDAKNGLQIAKVLDGFISRKVVKQTVMTVVYGVTRYGSRLQIEKRLREIEEFPTDHMWEASHYLVRLVFNSLKEMFKRTREIQDWLTDSARLISKCGHPVEWVTPLGLPIIQPYHRKRCQRLKTTLQYIHVSIGHDANMTNLHLSSFSSTCSLLSPQITMSSANIIVHGDSCLTSSVSLSITIATRRGSELIPDAVPPPP
ncbi:DNA-directed RNA polymerase, mitochondrial isoform X2 [Antennarius striatus]|uniref:DNA-directed RNA polymerase, mitochondrial isoform X2 n=1 Tax=Antennarius striatus TaxID=241820 RepID=UPI0035B16AA7